MALLTIVEASKQFKVARSHLYKKINDGELSTQLNENGTKVIQYVDLLRVFGESSTNILKTTEDSPQVVVEDKLGQPLRSSEDIIFLLKEQVSELKKDKEEMSKRLDDMSSKHDKLLLLIEHNAFSNKDNKNSPQVVVEDKLGQPLRSSEDKRKTSFSLVIFSILICLVLLGTITALYLRYIEII